MKTKKATNTSNATKSLGITDTSHTEAEEPRGWGDLIDKTKAYFGHI